MFSPHPALCATFSRKTGEGKRQNALQQFPLSRFTGEGAPKGRVRD